MRYHLFAVFLFISFVHCVGQKQQSPESITIKPFLLTSDSSITFKTTIKIPSTTLTGLLIVKRSDELTYRTALISELGMSLFELELQPDSFHLVSGIDVLKKHDLLQILAKQLFLIIHPFTEKSKPSQSVKRTIINYNFAEHGYNCQLDSFQRVSSAKSGKFLSKIRINYFYNNKHLPLSIGLKQSGIRIKWTLELLEQN